ncbi:hypothetical protein [Methylibium sp.]|uniref:hypothetical protein n=1 Tax=Methylibium sp. TaxID=2067992 RepID=UPI003D0E5631
MTEEVLIFEEAGNYRGCLEAKREGDAYFWRVECDVHEQAWEPIPAYLYEALKKYSEEKKA